MYILYYFDKNVELVLVKFLDAVLHFVHKGVFKWRWTYLKMVKVVHNYGCELMHIQVVKLFDNKCVAHLSKLT